jgi:hypothetical protein
VEHVIDVVDCSDEQHLQETRRWIIEKLLKVDVNLMKFENNMMLYAINFEWNTILMVTIRTWLLLLSLVFFNSIICICIYDLEHDDDDGCIKFCPLINTTL